MQNEAPSLFKKELFSKTLYLCLLGEKEVSPFLNELREKHSGLKIDLHPKLGSLQIVFQSPHPLEPVVGQLEKRFSSFFCGTLPLDQALHQAFLEEKKTLALAESCTGGRIAACLSAIPDASQFLLGSLVTYCNTWKERFLQVSHSTLCTHGAVSAEAVKEMVQGLFAETDADFALAVSGIAGPKGGTPQKPVGTIYLAVGQRGRKIDIGRIQAPPDRATAIELATQTALGALWRRLVHNALTFS